MSRRFGMIATVTAGAVVFRLLSYSFAIAIALPGAQRAGSLATIATGIAVASVALFAYKPQPEEPRSGTADLPSCA